MIGFIANYLGASHHGDTVAESGEDAPPGRPRPESAAAVLTDDELLPHIVQQFRDGEVSDEQLRTLREHLTPTGNPPLEVKLDHLRSKVADLEAYTDALETFIDGEGTAQDVLDALRADISATDEELAALAGRVAAVEDDQAAVWTELSRLHDGLASLGDYVHDLDGRHSREISRVDRRVETVEQSLEDALDPVRADIDQLEGQLAEVRAQGDALEVAVRSLGPLKTTVSAIEDDLEELGPVPDEVARLSDQVDALEPVTDAMEGIRDDVAELEAFRSEFIRAVGAD